MQMRPTSRTTGAKLALAAAATLLLTLLAVTAWITNDASAQSDSPPDQPARPTQTSVSHDSVTFSWANPDDSSITGYQILRRNRDTDAKRDFTVIENDTGDAGTTYTDNTVSPSTKYGYRIKARNVHGLSERSQSVRITTPSAPPPTPEPTATATPEPTATATPEPTATATPEPTATATPEPTATATPEPTPEPDTEELAVQKQQLPKNDRRLRSHNTSHRDSNDITLDFYDGTDGVDLTGNASSYDIAGVHMDASHVYVALNSPIRGVYKFARSNGTYVTHAVVTNEIKGLAGNATHVWVGDGIAAKARAKATLSVASGQDDGFSRIGASGSNDKELYAIGEVVMVGSNEYFTISLSETSIFSDGTRIGPRIKGNRRGVSNNLGGPNVAGDVLEMAGLTLDVLEVADLTTDGSMVYAEYGDGTGAFAFENLTTASGLEANFFRDVVFDPDGGYDGLFFDGSLLWSIDVDSFNAGADTMVLRAFEPGDPEIPVPDEVTSVDGSLVRTVWTRYWTCTDDPCEAAKLKNDGYARSVGFVDLLTIDADGDGSVDMVEWTDNDGNTHTVPLRLYGAGGFMPHALWGDGSYVYAVDNHTKAVYAISKADLDAGTFDDASMSLLRSLGAPFDLDPDDRSEDAQIDPAHLMYPRAVWGNATHVWVSDDNNHWLRAFLRINGERDSDLDVELWFNDKPLMAMGVWANENTMWVNALSGRIFKINLATDVVTQPSGFDDLKKSNAPRDLWSDGHTLWVAAPAENRIRAYDLDTGARKPSHEIVLVPQGTSSKVEVGGIWSDGQSMYVANRSSGEIQIYCLTSCN